LLATTPATWHGIRGNALLARIESRLGLSRASSLLRGGPRFPKPTPTLLESPHDPDASPQHDFRQPRLAMVALI